MKPDGSTNLAAVSWWTYLSFNPNIIAYAMAKTSHSGEMVACHTNKYGAPCNALSHEIRAAITELAALKFEVLQEFTIKPAPDGKRRLIPRDDYRMVRGISYILPYCRLNTYCWISLFAPFGSSVNSHPYP